MQEIETLEQLADAIVDSANVYDPKSLLSAEQQKAKWRNEVLETLQMKDVSTRLNRAINTLLKDGVSLLSVEEQKQMWADLNKMATGATKWEEATQDLQHALGISNTSMRLWYRIANDQYQREQFEQAGDIFTLLTILNPLMETFWLGLGGTHQMLGEYQEAMNAYDIAIDVNESNALPVLLTCECLLNLDKKNDAEEAWKYAMALMETQEKQAAWESLAKALQTKLSPTRS